MVLSDLDRTLLARCLNGDDGAWEDFVDRYLPLITHVVASASVSRLGGLPEQVRDDLVAEVLLSLVDQDFAVLRRFRGQSSLGTYLVVVSRRIAVRKLAKMRTVPKSSVVVVVNALDGATSGALDIDNSDEVQSLLAALPPEEAKALRMYHLEHKSYSDIGTHFGIAENSVGPLLSRARERMRGLRK